MLLRCAALNLLSCAVLSACQFVDLDRDLKELESLSYIEGSISLDPTSENSIAIALFSDELRRDQLINAKLVESRDFLIGAPPGRYVLFAFEDRNRDFRYQLGEPAGVAGAATPIVLQADKSYPMW